MNVGSALRISFLAALWIMTFGLAACSSIPEGPVFTPAAEPDAGKALVYIFRSREKSDWDADVRINDQPVVKLSIIGYTALQLPAGRYVVSKGPLAGNPIALEFDVGAGTSSALYLDSVIGTQELMGFMVTGKVVSPMFSSSAAGKTPFIWGFIEKINFSGQMNHLKTRRWQPPAKIDLQPLPPAG